MSKFKVLVIEDDELLRDGVKDLLEYEGCEVDTAADGAAGLERLQRARSPHHLIFLDLNMPRMSGQEFLKRVQNTLEFSAIPIVIMTAVPNVQIGEAQVLLQKPMEFEEIVEKLNHVRRDWEYAQGTARSV